MNPELQRNLWLEITARRVGLMVILLLLVFLAARSTAGIFAAGRTAEYLFYGLVVVWGARHAAQAIVNEIRDRTWDSQRLSSLTPWALTWGKLLGATSYVWLGGLICLAIQLYLPFVAGAWSYFWINLFYYLSLGLMAQTVALFASLIAVRRRQTHSRLDVFLYQFAGLFAALLVWWAWKAVTVGDSGFNVFGEIDTIAWWGRDIDARIFHLASVVLFLVWALVGCYRLMRLELQIENTPLVWAGFVAFMALYMAGFDSRSTVLGTLGEDLVATRLFAAAGTAAFLTYVAMLFEPKDRVLYRWLAKTLAERRFGAAIKRLQACMISYAATLVLSLVLVLRLGTLSVFLDMPAEAAIACVLAILGFLTRDLAIFMIFAMGKRRSDYPALVTIAMLYGVVPTLFGPSFNGFFFPLPTSPAVTGPLIAWGEAAALWFAVIALANRGGIFLRQSEVQPVRK